jgi:NAD(P)-dependent dehydrogenase (short-subunit alcohol dehydrogenase family)
MEIEGRHVVVTGGGRGIGRALALRFADAGARAVVVSDMDEATAQTVAAEVGGLAVTADVGREEDIRALVARAEDANGPIDLFFSNAGITGPSGGPEVADEDWDLLWRVNTMAHVWAARALLPGMLARGEGYIVSTASAAGLLAQLGALGYTVTKHAAVAVAEWLSMTYGDRGIRVSCLCPQYVRTPMVTDGSLPLDKLEAVATILEPEQVADVVVEAIREERFLILPHPEVATYMAKRGDDHERWLRGMRRLQGQLGV